MKPKGPPAVFLAEMYPVENERGEQGVVLRFATNRPKKEEFSLLEASIPSYPTVVSRELTSLSTSLVLGLE